MDNRNYAQFLTIKKGYSSLGLQKLIAARLKEARKDARLDQVDVAEALGIARNTYTQIETGRNALKVEYLARLPEILHKPVTYFLGLTSPDLADDEFELVSLYRTLSEFGKEDMLGFIRLLSEREKYRDY